MEKNKPRLIGIFGTGRNGSTLLLRLLDGIPQTYCHPAEVNFLLAMNDLVQFGRVRWKTGANATRRPLSHLKEKIETETLLHYYSFQIKELKEAYLSQIKNKINLKKDPLMEIKLKKEYSPKEFVEFFLESISNWVATGSESIENIIFKTIETPYVADYEKLFENMRFIHIIRNPIDVWSSQKRTLMRKKKCLSCHLGWDNLETMIEKRWIPHCKTILNKQLSEKSSRRDKHFLVKYEDLIENPKRIVSDICQWLGVGLPANSDKQTVLGGRFVKRLFAEPSQKGVATPVEVVKNLKEQFHYEEVITPRERNFIIWRLFSMTEQPPLNYLEGVKKPKRIKLLFQWLFPDKWEFQHANSLKKIIKTLIAFFYRRFYVFKNIVLI